MRPVADLPDFDMHGERFAQDPLGTLAGLRERAPMARTRRGIEVLDYDWNSLLYADRRLETPGVEGLLEKGVPPTFEDFLRNGFLLGFHGERHDLVRRVIQKGFTIREVEGQRAMLRALSHELIDEFAGLGETDFVAEYTMKFPVIAICRMLGVPETDIAEFREAGLVLHLMGAVPLAPGFPKIEASLGVLRDYVTRLVAQRRAGPGEDFISALIEAQETEGRLTESELVWNIANLLFAAQDTTRFQLAGVVRAAIEQPGEAWERLAADPTLVNKVLWEGMRFHPAVRFSTRRAFEDFELEGFAFAKGQWVFLHNLAATRDPEAFPDPDRYDIDRKEQFNLAFGRGLHHCVGQMLARIGMEESLIALSSRLTDLKPAGPVRTTHATAMVGGPEAMPVRFRER